MAKYIYKKKNDFIIIIPIHLSLMLCLHDRYKQINQSMDFSVLSKLGDN